MASISARVTGDPFMPDSLKVSTIFPLSLIREVPTLPSAKATGVSLTLGQE
jgi:hypothetical protein